MNAYIIDAGQDSSATYYFAVVGEYVEPKVLFGMYFAETRGKARALAASEWGLEFIDKMSIYLFARDVDRAAGKAADGDPIWELPNWENIPL
jgi:hypothetical protein